MTYVGGLVAMHVHVYAHARVHSYVSVCMSVLRNSCVCMVCVYACACACALIKYTPASAHRDDQGADLPLTGEVGIRSPRGGATGCATAIRDAGSLRKSPPPPGRRWETAAGGGQSSRPPNSAPNRAHTPSKGVGIRRFTIPLAGEICQTEPLGDAHCGALGAGGPSSSSSRRLQHQPAPIARTACRCHS